MTTTYNRQDGETTNAYTAFTIYRDMAAARSLDRVEEKIYGTQLGHKRGTNLTALNGGLGSGIGSNVVGITISIARLR